MTWQRLRRAWGWLGRGGMGWGCLLAAAVPVGAFRVTALVPVDVAVLSSAVSAVAFALVPSSALPAPLLVASLAPAALRLPEAGCFRDGCHRQRRADHGRARDRAEQVVKGSFHSGASR